MSSTPPDRPDRFDRAALRSVLPGLLLALAGACSLSAALGLTLALTGRGPAPLPLLIAPPALVLVAAPLFVLRALRRSG